MRAVDARGRLTPLPFAAAYGLHSTCAALHRAAVPVRWNDQVRMGSRGLCGAFWSPAPRFTVHAPRPTLPMCEHSLRRRAALSVQRMRWLFTAPRWARCDSARAPTRGAPTAGDADRRGPARIAVVAGLAVRRSVRPPLALPCVTPQCPYDRLNGCMWVLAGSAAHFCRPPTSHCRVPSGCSVIHCISVQFAAIHC